MSGGSESRTAPLSGEPEKRSTVAPKRMAVVLARLRDGLTLHNSAIMTLLMIVFGFLLIGRRTEGL